MEGVAASGGNLEQWRLDQNERLQSLVNARFSPEGSVVFWRLFGEEINAIRLHREAEQQRAIGDMVHRQTEKAASDQLGWQIASALILLLLLISFFVL
jgi:hypothetical protein